MAQRTGVDITLIRFHPYRLDDGRVVVSFTRTFPVPSVEEFTIGRRVTQGTADDPAMSLPEAPWDLEGFQRLAEQGNVATLALLDLCAADEAAGVSVQDIVRHANITPGQVRGQLAGLTMRLKNLKYGFAQNEWPVDITWLPGGVASYSMHGDLAALWRQVRGTQQQGSAVQAPTARIEPGASDGVPATQIRDEGIPRV